MDTVKNAYWFAPYNLENPSARYRGWHVSQHLSIHYGLKVHFVVPQRNITGLLQFFNVYFLAILDQRNSSRIVIQKVCSNRWYARMLRVLVALRSEDCHYDLDDAENLRHPPGNLQYFLRKCGFVTVGSPGLADYCRHFNGNTHLITSPLREHGFRKKKRSQRLHRGWVGDSGAGHPEAEPYSHRNSMFTYLFPQLLKLQKPVKLSLLGVHREEDRQEVLRYFRQYPHIELHIPLNRQWQDDDWVYRQISDFDVGLSILNNHLFNHCKSAFKLKQYLSVGVPVIASAVGENKRFVKHRYNGFLCHKSSDILMALEAFASMSQVDYKRMCEATCVDHEKYSTDTFCRKLLEVWTMRAGLPSGVTIVSQTPGYQD